ncbi:N5-glutamine methyltransferase family protein [Nitrincola nitratireducens]|uniref:peptide chain release factor N(5)-glutamine methyltransferase n=1 Tax=Nitrincola nitratireducens TaxID=1229521 RepID=W9VHV2_9GAMM|nr:Release factor glutamine methyltransferase [Nitrincola nitratireducens]
MKVKDALACARILTDSDSPRVDTETLLLWVLDKPRSYVYTWPDADLSPAQAAQFTELIEKRRQGEPVAHLIGYRDFWTLRLAVSNATLIPRPETEMLVEWALEHLPSSAQRVADLGTGTGAIALALASERPSWQLIATDRIPEAIELARSNAWRLTCHRWIFDWGVGWSLCKKRFI